MAKVTIEIDDTNAAIVSVLGADMIDALADSKGYTAQVHNPDYVLPVGGETLNDETKEPNDVGEYPQIPNPDYVAGVGEPTITNPQTKAEHVGTKVLKEAILPYLTKEMEAREKRTAEDKVAQIKEVIEGAAVITTS